MTDITDVDSFDAVPLLEPGEKVLGGVDGPSNKQAEALANRTAYLKARVEELGTPTTGQVVEVTDSAARLALPVYEDITIARQQNDSSAWALGPNADPSVEANWIRLVDTNKINMIGTLASESDLSGVDTSSLVQGDGYFVGTAIAIWSGSDWTISNDLKGDKGITLLGVWPDANPLPDPSTGSVGDSYIWKSDIWVLAPSPGDWQKLGLEGPIGKSAYQSWLDLGNSGTEQDFANSLIGKSAYQIWLDVGNTGSQTDFANSLVGKSAYQIWLDAGNSGTQADYIAAQKGAKGDKGDTGDSAYQEWLNAGNSGTSTDFLLAIKGAKGDKGDPAVAYVIEGVLTDAVLLPRPGVASKAYYVDNDLYVWVDDQNDYILIPGVAGASAYDIWIAEGNSGTTSDFILSLKGDKGDQGIQGKSTYDIWLDAGNTGTQDDFIAAQKGDPGKNLNVLGTVANQAALPVSPADQDGWVTLDTGHLWVYSATGSTWNDLGPFQGQNGKNAYQEWLDLGNSGTEQDFLNSLKGADGQNGTNGVDGKNIVIKDVVNTFAYLPGTPAEQDAYAVRDENAIYMWINAAWKNMGVFKGTDGTNGVDGKDTYQLWLDLGNTGTLADFMAAQKGEKGLDGKDGQSIEVVKVLTVDDQAIPDAVSNDGKSYIDINNNIWVSSGGIWNNVGSISRGADGLPGPPLSPLGTVPSFADLPDPTTLVAGNAYFTADTKMMYVIVADSWSGPFDIIGLKGDQGIQGPAGTSITVLGSYPTLADLQAAQPTGNLGDGYLIGPDLAVWTTDNGGEWIDVGQVRGPEGPIGPEGPEGKQGLPGTPGKDGADGKDGKDTYQIWLDAGNNGTRDDFLLAQKGDKGDKGDPAVAYIIEGVLTDVSLLPRPGTASKAYYVSTDLYIWVDDLGDYVVIPGVAGASAYDLWLAEGNTGTLSDFFAAYKGDIGPTGLQGTSIVPLGTVATSADLPDASTLVEGNAYFTADTKLLYVVVSGVWGGPFDIVGMKGDQGEQGIPGTPGTSINILGSYATLADLQAAHPTGTLGDGYLIGTNLAIWSTSNGGEWIDVGTVQGPPGPQGPIGKDGPMGKTGLKGDRGTVWITLPAGVDAPSDTFAGNNGDWAVSDTFKVYYKDSTGWHYWGQLVAGDVNSPLLALGKVVRLGDQWVPLLVDEVPNLAAGKSYVRIQQAGDPTLGEWAELDLTQMTTYTTNIATTVTELDLTSAQAFSINNPSARTLTIKAGTEPATGRSGVYALILNGPGAITFGFPVTWLGQPAQMNPSVTLITLLWDGVGNRWLAKDGGGV